MRSIGFALVLASLAFGTGGVAVVGRADATSEAAAQQSVAPTQSPAPLVRAKGLPGECKVPTPRGRGPKLQKSARTVTLPNDAVPLNTRGYNYGAAELPQLPPELRPPAAPRK